MVAEVLSDHLVEDFVDLGLDALSVDRGVVGLALRGELTEFKDECGDLVLLRGIDLVLELVHS